MDRNHSSILLAAIAIGLWSTAATAFKLALRELHFLPLVAYSSLASFLFLAIYLIIRGRFRGLVSLRPEQYLRSALLGLLNPFVYYLVLFSAYSRLLGGQALVLNYTWPISLVLLSALILHKPLRLKTVAALCLSFTGVILVAFRNSGSASGFRVDDPLGVLLALSSSIIWALFWIYNVKDKRDDIVKLCLSFAFGTIFSFILLFATGRQILPSLTSASAVAYIGCFEMGLTFVIWLKALKSASSPAVISNLVFLSPFLSLFLLHFVVGERLSLVTFLGLTIIIAGILFQRSLDKGRHRN